MQVQMSTCPTRQAAASQLGRISTSARPKAASLAKRVTHRCANEGFCPGSPVATLLNKAGAIVVSGVVLSGIAMVPAGEFMQQPAYAAEQELMFPTGREQSATVRDMGKISQAQEIAVTADRAPSYLAGIEPEQPQIPSPGQQQPQVPIPDLPKSSMPEMPKFSMPKSPVEPPPGSRMNTPQDVPKTESPALPVPAPSGGINQMDKEASSNFNVGNWFQGANPTNAAENLTKGVKQEVVEPVREKASQVKQAEKKVETALDKRLARRHGLPLFLTQFLLTAGLSASVIAFVLKFDAVMEAGEQTEAFIIRVAERVESPKTASK